MTIAIIFCVVFALIFLSQITVVDYVRFYRSYDIPKMTVVAPSEPTYIEQLWSGVKNNQKSH